MASISNIFIDQGATFTTTVTVTDANGDAEPRGSLPHQGGARRRRSKNRRSGSAH